MDLFEPTPSSAVNSSLTAVNSLTQFTPKTFSNLISFKLDEEDFLPWKKQASAAIRLNKLQDHLKKEKMPQRFKSKEDKESEIESE